MIQRCVDQGKLTLTRMRGPFRGLCLAAFLGVAQVSVAAEPAPSGVLLERAKGEQLATAVGHYARAKAMLNAAIREFDLGYKEASPESIIDVTNWRSSLIDRATELDHILDPQPRATKGGVQFEADTRLLNQTAK